MSTDDPDTHDGPEPLVRSIFFYNQHPQLQSTVGLHFFEPRYRILVQRALQDVQGVESAHVDLASAKATVIGEAPAETPLAALAEVPPATAVAETPAVAAAAEPPAAEAAAGAPAETPSTTETTEPSPALETPAAAAAALPQACAWEMPDAR